MGPGKWSVHIDSCWFASSTAQGYRYVPNGLRVDGLISGRGRPRNSLIAARMDGGLEEPLLCEGTCDTMVFNIWLQGQLCSHLNAQHLTGSCDLSQILRDSSAHRGKRCEAPLPCHHTPPISIALNMILISSKETTGIL